MDGRSSPFAPSIVPRDKAPDGVLCMGGRGGWQWETLLLYQQNVDMIFFLTTNRRSRKYGRVS
jgi:hypothetical protein